uniref:Uncharacterized protein n=1 Tax=Geospiza parvula TaxID=87175 RepID=A0A8U8C8G3_GEOPR
TAAATGAGSRCRPWCTTLQLGLLMKFKSAAVTTTGKKPVTPGLPLRKWEISRDEPYL